MQVIGDWVALRTVDEVLAAMKEASVPSGPILSTADIYAEEQYQARNMFHTVRPPSGRTAPQQSTLCIAYLVHLTVNSINLETWQNKLQKT